MKKLLIACMITTASFGPGCSTTAVVPASTVVAKKIPRGARICVITPVDGSYEGDPYPGSGATVASAFNTVLSRSAQCVVAGQGSDFASGPLSVARARNCAYVVVPRITHWEDRATEWSGKRDKMELSVRVLRADNGNEVASATINGKSAWATFGGDHPQDLVAAPVEAFVATLF
jgi:hypothetical protein